MALESESAEYSRTGESVEASGTGPRSLDPVPAAESPESEFGSDAGDGEHLGIPDPGGSFRDLAESRERLDGLLLAYEEASDPAMKSRIVKEVRGLDDRAADEWLMSTAADASRDVADPLMTAVFESVARRSTSEAAQVLLSRLEVVSDPEEASRLFWSIAGMNGGSDLRSCLESVALGSKAFASEWARSAATVALSNYPDEAAEMLLSRLADDSSPAVRDAARIARRRLSPDH